MKRRHPLGILLALLCLCAALSGCDGLQQRLESRLWESAAPTLVQGNVDLLYKGSCTQEYLELVGSSQEDCLPYYQECMELQAQAFLSCFEVYDPDGTQRERFTVLMKELYARAEYTVGACAQVDETHFLVDVSVSPLDFPQQVCDSFSTGLQLFHQRYGQLTDADLNAMTDSEYAEYEALWADGIYTCCRTALSSPRYREAVTVQMAVSKTPEGLWAIEDASLQTLDGALLYYPDDLSE